MLAFTTSAMLLRPRGTLQLATSPRRPKPGLPAAAPPAATRPTSTATATVAAMWRQVQGSGDWAGLLQPLHPVLRDEVARYGGLVGACYDGLDMDRSSAGYMRCKHRRERILEEAGAAGYEVTRYIYAAPDVAVPVVAAQPAGAWVGYVAVSTDEMTRRLGRRDVLVSFRGTVTPAEWTANLMSLLRPARLDARDPRPDVKVESGFLNLYTSAPGGGAGSCREQLLREVSRLIASRPGDEDVSVTLAGHSMGGALALLLGYDLAELGLNRRAARRVPVSVFSFGGPRVGNAAFKARCDALGVKVLRVANVRDPVTNVPGALLNERTGRLLGGWAGGACYVHVGAELALDFASLHDLGSVHDLGAYVSCLARGSGRDRDGTTRRRRARRRAATESRGGAASAAARPRDRLQLTALGFLLFLYGYLLHLWPLVITNPPLISSILPF
ncbi:hypothetical protein C2845_PM15G05430 [Panicum miliaceum]|uniref:Fungal lipase-type domain-containing protein n=1 Tax=Panicum miliaceum TaxID=4540 RepID=A0A3L6QB75_PANMI|nr:hypothetical protein C2845_PM15G05430 [Panicum miliaceum]